jgi:hypothetical protein
VLTTFGLISTVSADLDSGLVGFWKFDETSGLTAYDSSGNGNNGAIKGPVRTTGKIGNALHFDGTNDSVVVASNPVFNLNYLDSSITLCAWVKDSTIGWHAIVCRHTGTANGSGQFGLCIKNRKIGIALGPAPEAQFISDSSIDSGAWTHIAATHTYGHADSVKLYINGVRVTGQWTSWPGGNGNQVPPVVAQPVTIGYNPWAEYPDWMSGDIDEVRIYKRALSASEVLELACTNRIYVDSAATGNNNGTNWANAFTRLKTASDSAKAGNQIWVAKGTYFPTTNTDRSISFQMKEGTILYGGFNTSTGDTTLLTRDWENNPTILSGDIGTRGDSTDNSYHVVIGANDAVLDGFIIEKGNSNSTYENMRGGGMENLSVSPYIFNCTFQNNHAINAGAMINLTGASPVIKNCMFLNNSVVWYGAGVYNLDNCAPYFSNCRFVENHNDSVSSGNTRNGGALYILDTCNVTLVNCEFIKNKMRGYGGGVFVSRYSNVNFYNCSFYRNIGMWYDRGGGAISLYGDSCTAGINNCILWKDSSALSGEVYILPNTGSFAKIKNSNIEGGWNGPKVYSSAYVQNLGGNINSDPLFNNPDLLDLSLSSSSPCIDSGDNSLVQTEKDINGNARIMDGNNDQTATVDMGPYEFQP